MTKGKKTMQNYQAPIPSKAQLDYLQDGLAAFIHFGINTYYEREWGDGREDINRFAPDQLDCDQWVRVLKETGFHRLILVVKHHDGFVLYPSQYTDHSVKNIAWRQGRGDILLEVSKAASKYDLDLGIYLSPWDAHDPRYSLNSQAQYNAYYLNQLREILENKAYGNRGVIKEIWLDGARGEGQEKVEYDFDQWFTYIRSKLGEDVCIFSTQATSLRWIGNEAGYAGPTLWQRVRADRMDYLQPVDLDYLNQGDAYGDIFSIGEADVSIRNGWFFKEGQVVKSVADLMDIYLHSVGMGTVLLLNIPPNKQGRLDEGDIVRLQEFQRARDQLLANCLGRAEFRPRPASQFDLDLGRPEKINLVEIRENISQGQSIAQFVVEGRQAGSWLCLYRGQTIGYRRLIPFPDIQVTGLRVRVLKTLGGPAKLDRLRVYFSQMLSQGQLQVDHQPLERVVKKGQKYRFTWPEIGEIDRQALYRIGSLPITALHGKHYLDRTWEFKGWEIGPVLAVEVDILDFEDDGKSHDFVLVCQNQKTGQKWQAKIRISSD